MGMSTHVIGFRPPDERWRQMKAVLKACEEAGVATPEEVDEFFNYQDPDPSGVQVELKVIDWNDPEGGASGVELLVEDIPEHVTIIRFFNSW